MKAASTKEETEWNTNAMENFHKKYNKVLLDKMAIEVEKARLAKENSDLRAILQQYLDGIAITEDAVDRDNTLLIINGKANTKPQVRRGATTSVDANTVVTVCEKQRAGRR